MSKHQKKPKKLKIKEPLGQKPQTRGTRKTQKPHWDLDKASCQGPPCILQTHKCPFPEQSPPGLETSGWCWCGHLLMAAARFLCHFSNPCIFTFSDSTLFTDNNTEAQKGCLIFPNHSFPSSAKTCMY